MDEKEAEARPVMGTIFLVEWVIVVKEIPISTRNRPRTHIGYGSSLASTKVRDSAETNRGRALNHWQKQTVRTLFEGGY